MTGPIADRINPGNGESVTAEPLIIDQAVFRKAIGQRVKALRISRNFTAAVIADAVGMSQSHYSRSEAGVGNFTSVQLVKLANAFDVEIGELLEVGDLDAARGES